MIPSKFIDSAEVAALIEDGDTVGLIGGGGGLVEASLLHWSAPIEWSTMNVSA